MRRLLAATAIASVALLTVGCGDDDKSPVATSGDSVDDTSADTSDNARAADDSGDDNADDTAGESDGNGANDTLPGPLSVSDDCRAAALAFATMVGGTSLGDVDAAIEQMKTRAPDEIAEEIVMLAELYGPIAEAIKAKGGDVTAAYSDPEILAMVQKLSTPEAAAAAGRVSAYFQENCGTGS